MKLPEIEDMAPVKRRRFMKLLGTALAAPAVPTAVRFACNEVVGGKAYALDAEGALPTYFLEINLRDQWDHGHFFVAPGLAGRSDLRRGETGDQAAIFFRPEDLIEKPNNIYLTPQSAALDPHVDTIAMIDTCEMFNGGIHGHESGNPIRSPGKTLDSSRPGYEAMYLNDPTSKFPGGNEAFHAATPTPASLHNYMQKKLEPTLRNGYTYKGISRSIHTVYHYGAGLEGAELDRVQDPDELYRKFPERVEDLSILPTEEEADTFAKLLEKVDQDFLRRRRVSEGAASDHESNVRAARDLLYSGRTETVSVPLTEEEVAYWSEGVPPGPSSTQIWEQAAWAFKILSGNMTRTASIEFDIVDIHGSRTADMMQTMTLQAALPFARLIESFKAAGIYDRTVIAMYTTDMSRPPAAGYSGDRGKNTIILAGGMVQGGYYGDVRVAGPKGDGHEYSYHRPDPETGVPGEGVTDNSNRTSQAAVWRTVMRAAGIPDAAAKSFPDTADAPILPFMLRG